eukprot:TRINITY_DN5211_c0_g1_i2.p1 TRINITY_DN5211_c0_g1~~TRINITY_DN5211_c0_g1_i2.p1  ORF type:complete len:873 (+),score=253.22 TRINITY_DN5211_c0_g1_i2:41-2659(+)
MDSVGSVTGLFYKKNDGLVPLVSLDVRCKVVDFCGDVEVHQVYYNKNTTPVEALFKFEHYNAALTNFEVHMDGHVCKGICKEKNEALDTYDDSLASGKGAYLVEQDKKDGVFKVSIGNLPPQKECHLIWRYITELDVVEGNVRLVLPVTRNSLQKVNNISNSVSLALDVRMQTDILKLVSPSHQIEGKWKIDGKNATLGIKDSNWHHSYQGKEFVLLVQVQNSYEPINFIEEFSPECVETLQHNIFLEEDAKLKSIGPQVGSNFFSIAPFPTKQQNTIPPALVISLYPQIETSEDILSEIIFLVDQSGSMSGTRINQAKNALQLFLRSLPQHSLFNIIGFGSKFSSLFTSSQKLTESTLATATKHVSRMEANMGGTNILDPLKGILSEFKKRKQNDPVQYLQYPKQIFCLTDGEVTNTAEVLKFVKNNIGDARIFTFGIGADASKALVGGIAKFGRGMDEYVVTGERIETKVMKQLKRALMPILKDIRVDWNGLVDPKYSTIPIYYPPVFDGERVLIYAFLTQEQNIDKKVVNISGTTGEQLHQWSISIDLKKEHTKGSLIHRLTAKSYTKALELAKENRQSVVQLGVQWGLVTKYTSYVAIDEREEATFDTMNLYSEEEEEDEEESYDSEGELKVKYETATAANVRRGDKIVVDGKVISIIDVSTSKTGKHGHAKGHFVGIDSEGKKVETILNMNNTISKSKQPAQAPPKTQHRAQFKSVSTVASGKGEGDSKLKMEEKRKPAEGVVDITPTVQFNSQTRPLDVFILQQRVDGSFILNDHFIKSSQISKTIPQIEASIPPSLRSCGLPEEVSLSVWVTTLALVIFDIKFNGSQEEWSLIADKAKKYIHQKIKQTSTDLSSLLQQATAFFSN